MITCHRTLLKIILNPILRRIGFSIVSCFDDNDKFLGYQLRSYPENCRRLYEKETHVHT